VSAGRLFFGLVLSFLLLTFSTRSSGQTTVPASDAERNLSLATGPVRIVVTDVKHDVSLPLRDLASVAIGGEREPREAEEVRNIPVRSGYKPADQPDPVLQRTTALGVSASAPTIINNFDGIGQDVFGTNIHVAPPDTNGAVGLTQYVQWVNVSFAVFDKASGNILPNFPVAANTLWMGFGGPCETNNDGDPIVMYDKLNDRWVFGQFAVRGPTGFLSNTLQCVAVSRSSDATGTYNRYAFQYNNEFDDYPKMAVWPDAYYVTFNMFNPNLTAFLGTDACAYDGNAMRDGLPATQICFQQAPTVGGVLPADVDGHTPPPPGSPNYMVEFDVNSLNLYKFHVDFANPSNSTFSGAINIPVAPFTPLCNGQSSCVPQPGTSTQLDSLADRLMYRLAYRNFGDHESLVVNHAVAANSSGGVRWYEIQNPNGTPIVAQQSTFAPDSSFRWMGSIAMDNFGDIALGYSLASSSVFPSIAFASRTPFDPANTLGAETTIITGSGSQTCCTRSGSPLTRWGDYSAIQVDPSDDCTFWYTTEYLKTSGVFNWNTRIASFKFSLCGLPDLTVTSTHSGNFTQGDASDNYTLTVTNVGPKQTDGTAVSVADTLPAGLTATAMSGSGWNCTLGTLTCSRNDMLTAHNSYPPITLTVKVANNAPGIVTNTVTVSGGGDQNTSNNTATDQTTVIQTGPDPSITKTHSGSFTEGLTGTYTITLTNVGLSPTDGTTVTVSDTLPAGLTFNQVTGTGWSCNGSSPVTCTRSDVLASNTSYPPITLTVNVANDAPASITNTATVSGGGDVNTLNNTANDKTTVTPVSDLTISKSHSGVFHQGQNQASYVLTVSNVGGGVTAGTVTVTDTVPAGLTPLFSSAPFPWGCGFNANTLTCTRNDPLPANQSYSQITLFVSVANDAPASVTNTATVSGGGEINTANDTATDPTTIQPSPDLTIAKSHSPDPFIVGQTGTYTITVSNVGHASTSGTVTVTDFLPNGLTATAISATGWSCSSTPTNFVNCSRQDSLAVGSSYPVITVTVSVNGGGPQVTNIATVSGGGEFNTANDSASDVTHVTGPVLSIIKSHLGNFTVGQMGNYIITVSNTGSVDTISSAVNVNDNLPTGMTAASASAPGWNCSGINTAFVNCTRSDILKAGQSYPAISLTVNVDGTTPPSIANFVSVTGGGDLNVHFFSDPTSVNVPDLAITKSHTGNFTLGQTGATYTITVSNVGTIATGGGTVGVTDILPFALNATAASGTGWSCNVSSPFLNCNRPAGALAPGASYPPITLTVNVSTIAPASVINSVSVGGISDSNLANNTASDTTTIIGFSITPNNTSATVTAGTSAGFAFSANVASNAATITFSASGLPPNSKATFNPTSVTGNGLVFLTVDTSGNGHTAALLSPRSFHNLTPYLAGVFAFVAALGIAVKNRRIRRRLCLVSCICAAALVLLVSGCGGGGSPPPPPPPPVVTPPGTYTITVTATSSNTSISPVNTPVTLVVK
jgi:uncharacterized repeat protein (TIGR01451 family)